MPTPHANPGGVSYPLFQFAYCGQFQKHLQGLQKLALGEPWEFRSTGNSSASLQILFNYVHHTFKRIKEEYDELPQEMKNGKICISNQYACFNTGLFTEYFEPIYGLFTENRNPRAINPWYLLGFYKHSDRELSKFEKLPSRAEYFKDISDLIFDYRLDIRVDLVHILDHNSVRLPQDLKEVTQLEGAINLAKKRVASNYRLAVPQYYEGMVQLLLPIFARASATTVPLVVYKTNSFYVGKTVLTIEMAYNNARLIARPDSDWLSIAP
ncbi:MAG TPA: DUF3825 domain-containing protein [Spirochaetia bacterium]|nr:DUF3825 domain-containing protein [Spirochaetia bacterium]